MNNITPLVWCAICGQEYELEYSSGRSVLIPKAIGRFTIAFLGCWIYACRDGCEDDMHKRLDVVKAKALEELEKQFPEEEE
jgi:hypothetical protein